MHAAIAITGLMSLMWLVSLLKKDASVIDVAWGMGFVIVAWTAFAISNPADLDGVMRTMHLLLPIMVTIWGLRLSGYILWRNHGKGEDPRYQQMRDKWSNSFWWVSLFTVFALQGAIMWVVSLPLQLVNSNSSVAGSWKMLLAVVGIVLWLVGLTFETVGDWQLARFKSRPENRGQVLQSGLWRYTRHPNYFGDFLVWWGFYVLALALAAPWWTLISPLLMSFLLLRVSGVSLLEKSLRESKPGYSDYVERTNAFFPWPSKK